MRVLVCGGRGFNSYGMMCLALDRLNAELGFGVLIDGGAAGADMLAKRPDVGVCFPGGRGTADMRKRMLEAGPAGPFWKCRYEEAVAERIERAQDVGRRSVGVSRRERKR